MKTTVSIFIYRIRFQSFLTEDTKEDVQLIKIENVNTDTR